jgi:hypothetical protein
VGPNEGKEVDKFFKKGKKKNRHKSYKLRNKQSNITFLSEKCFPPLLCAVLIERERIINPQHTPDINARGN